VPRRSPSAVLALFDPGQSAQPGAREELGRTVRMRGQTIAQNNGKMIASLTSTLASARPIGHGMALQDGLGWAVAVKGRVFRA
jgi:hypothetical protein